MISPLFDSEFITKLESFCIYIEQDKFLCLKSPKIEFFTRFIDSYNADKKQQKERLIITPPSTNTSPKPLIVDITESQKKHEQEYLYYCNIMCTDSSPDLKQSLKYKKQAVKETDSKEKLVLFGKAISNTDGTIPILFLKRAECLYNVEKYLSCRRDLTQVIDYLREKCQESVMIKSLLLRAKCHLKLGSLDTAKRDLSKLKKYDLKEEQTRNLNNITKLL